MNNTAKGYGKALFSLACESNAKNEYASALGTVEKIFKSNPEYSEILSSPNIPISEKLSAMVDAFGDAVPEHVLSFLMLMCEKGHLALLREAIREYTALLNASERVTVVRVTSAVELSSDEKQRLKAKFEKLWHGDVRLEYSVDSTLLGGLITEVNGKITDGSLRCRLSRIKEVLYSEHKT